MGLAAEQKMIHDRDMLRGEILTRLWLAMAAAVRVTLVN